MMQSISEKHAVVDLTNYNEIENAKEADPVSGMVVISVLTYAGEYTETKHFPYGIRIISRR